MPRVAVVGPYSGRSTRDAVRRLRQYDDVTLVAFCYGDRVFEKIGEFAPDALVIDDASVNGEGFDLLRETVQRLPNLPAVVITAIIRTPSGVHEIDGRTGIDALVDGAFTFVAQDMIPYSIGPLVTSAALSRGM